MIHVIVGWLIIIILGILALRFVLRLSVYIGVPAMVILWFAAGPALSIFGKNYAAEATVPFQLLIAPRTPRARFEDDGPTGARMLHDALSRLARWLGASPPLNLWVRTAPRGAEHFCWRIDILPRLVHLAGLELGAGVGLNIVPPEQVAAELRD